MFTPPHIASQLAAQRQREMQVQAHERRLRRQFRAQPGRRPVAATTARPCHSWRARAQAVLHALAHRPAMRRPAI
jgi:hypothetical protein